MSTTVPEKQGLTKSSHNHSTSNSGSGARSISVPDPVFIISLREPQKKKGECGIPAANGGKVDTKPSYVLELRENRANKDKKEGSYTYNLNDDVGVEEWSRALKEQLTPTSHVIILINGFNNHAEKVVTRYMAFQDCIRDESATVSTSSAHVGMYQQSFNVVPVCFDWPARKAVRYVADRRTARKSAKLLFSSCIDVLQQQVGIIPPENIHILTFSMGGFLLQKAFREKKNDNNGDKNKNEPSKIGHVMISQADVARRDFGFARRSRKQNKKQSGINETKESTSTSKLECLTSWIDKDLTIYWSSKDLPLRMMSTIRMHARLGLKGLPITNKNIVIGSSSSSLPSLKSKPKSTLTTISTSIHNVNCTAYYNETYRHRFLDPDQFLDSHEFPFLGFNPQKVGNGKFYGDEALLRDVYQVITDSTITQRSEVKGRRQSQGNQQQQQYYLDDSNKDVHCWNLGTK